MPVFSEDGKVEMVGSGSEHEFPGVTGMAGRICRYKDVKPTGEAGFLLLRYKVDDSDQKELSITDAKNDNLFYLINATCHKFMSTTDEK